MHKNKGKNIKDSSTKKCQILAIQIVNSHIAIVSCFEKPWAFIDNSGINLMVSERCVQSLLLLIINNRSNNGKKSNATFDDVQT